VRLLEAALPLAIAAAILQYQLWEIDLVVRRVLVYGALTACVVTGYALVLTGLSAMIQAQGGVLVALLAATLVTLAFEPLRARLQRSARRLLYGERDEPYAALLRLGASLEATPVPGTVPARIVATVAQSLKLPYVAVQLGYGEALQEVAAQGAAPAPGLEQAIPITHQGEVIGRLLVTPRRGEQTLSAADRRLLDELARQAGATLHAQALTDELQHAREGLVLAREEERRRIRRDLHDGLGPTLAAQTLKAGAARHLVRANPELAEQVLGGLEADLTTALADVRRLVYDLRPPALDELGLAGALRAAVAQFAAPGTTTPAILIDAPAELPPLAAAVEVAAYRITYEALSNAVRHSGARSIHVALTCADDLCLRITDDGHGIAADATPGVGLRSMRERASELSGTCEVGPGERGGTRVQVRLPTRG
jgi:signal transduction histidine kinase